MDLYTEIVSQLARIEENKVPISQLSFKKGVSIEQTPKNSKTQAIKHNIDKCKSSGKSETD
jgi:hypothetical protein